VIRATKEELAEHARMLEEIEVWRAAPLWAPKLIAKITTTWFQYLGKH